jgi:ketosteroid isomerase-like protein
MLKARPRRDEPLDTLAPPPIVDAAAETDPEHEALLADSVGLALLVVLETLTPAERLAFVLHDMFALSFNEIAAILERSPETARQLASRARRRVHGATPPSDSDPATERAVVEAFLSAARDGDFDALLALLDPNVELRAVTGPGRVIEARGAEPVAHRATAYAQLGLTLRRALINGSTGWVGVTTRTGELFSASALTFRNGRITTMSFITDPDQLQELDLTILEEGGQVTSTPDLRITNLRAPPPRRPDQVRRPAKCPTGASPARRVESHPPDRRRHRSPRLSCPHSRS